MMLGNGRHRRIVASTLCEIRGAIALAQEGILDEVRLAHSHSSTKTKFNQLTQKDPLRPSPPP